jgi:catechol 2,3-dioxygenase-like lactoylglutathione lyase family enzyme
MEVDVKYHLGRLIDHVHLVVADLDASKAFYRAVLRSLGREFSGEGDGYFYADELFVSPGDQLSHVHLAFQTHTREDVHRFYEAALGAGGVDNGAPGERHYHPGYYAAFILDPDGNNIEAVHHGPADRSAASIVVTPKD